MFNCSYCDKSIQYIVVDKILTSPARLSVCLYGLRIRKRKKVKICVNIPQGRTNRCANFWLRRSKIRVRVRVKIRVAQCGGRVQIARRTTA